eukprot:CAMPEP_0176200652 /NCGR_PEP_ID=MMETSP0121_2-20121125/9169_1 /TAXON_ID=160619 /ORGANISM="Kryptoperidinium foliaceum, Strain CCMP 1326" /LENGTH=62 /DNA_ID=CAMNT_0017539521 /DNA_START=64 /DNA_END=249 /DNA_ORIENTATION=+
MAATMVDSGLVLPAEQQEVVGDVMTVRFKVSGAEAFELDLDAATTARDVKKLAKEMCGIEPE